ncbi:unnamed protein product [Effrenium voratum]|uniref:non-specific serine/threonine protein kinase n=1 Tax=Effrenium voratum TaxID=2562239 RepID=A0AA36NDP1_9DINO|nr:unnamed protein product [Effrenium voratum]
MATGGPYTACMSGTPETSGTAPTAPDLGSRQLALAIANPRLTEQMASVVFRKADANRDGRLSYEELLRLLPQLYQELGLPLVDDEPSQMKLVWNRMRRFDRSSDGFLELSEFLQLYRWTLHRKYEDLKPPHFTRSEMLKSARPGVPAQFYAINDLLGTGSFGIVHGVTEKTTGLQRVMKTVNKMKLEASGSPLACLDEEIKVLALLDHPRVLRFFEWFADSENIYMITDMCWGGELEEVIQDAFLQRQLLPQLWVRRIFHQATDAIGYCHSKGVMHKDLKFQNILLQNKLTEKSRAQDINIVIIDVGLAELFGPRHGKPCRCRQRSGSLPTMAPEVLAGDFSYKCDIWSLGCMLYAAFNKNPIQTPGQAAMYPYPFCTGKPGRGDPLGMGNLLREQKKGPNMKYLDANLGVHDLVRRMLSFEESKRPSAEECFHSTWLSCAPGSMREEEQELAKEETIAAILAPASGKQEHRTWWQAATTEAACQLPGSLLEPLARRFKAQLRNASGAIEKQALVDMLVKMKVPADKAERAACAADFSGDGLIEFSEFVAVCLPAARELFAISLQTAFHHFDTNSNGNLDCKEVEQLLVSGKIEEGHLPRSKTIQAMVEELDANHNGLISFPEFQQYFMTVDNDMDGASLDRR